MNLILLFPEDFVDGGTRVCLQGRRHRHVRKVHRAAPGDELCVGLAGGRIGRGKLLRIDARELEMEVHFESDPPAALGATVVLALPRPLVLKRSLLFLSSMGVKRIALIAARRVEKTFWNARDLRPEVLHRSLVLGLEQARDTILPELQLFRSFREFTGGALPGLSAHTRCLVAHPHADTACPRNVGEPVTLAVGPEGGFVEEEVRDFEACGFERVQLGPRILRIESALPALLGRLF